VSERNDPCWCGSGRKWKKCHAGIPAPQPTTPTEELRQRYLKQYGILLKSPEQIAGIRKASQLAAKILDEACRFVKEGVTTEEIDNLVLRLHQEAGATPASLGYGQPPFPKSCCTSINDVICHGIPDKRPLQKGDILNIDITAILDGYYGDCSRMVLIEPVCEEKKRVCEASHACLIQAIEILKPGLLLSEIGNTIQRVAEEYHCSVVYQFVGHGVGVCFHEPPQILHCANRSQIPLVPGMTFTIEPMINAGLPEVVVDPEDGWTARTTDGRPSAQYEHTLLITETGYEVLTLLSK